MDFSSLIHVTAFLTLDISIMVINYKGLHFETQFESKVVIFDLQ